MDTKSILFYAAEGTPSEFESQVKLLEKRQHHRRKHESSVSPNHSMTVDEFWETKDTKGRNVLFHAALTDNYRNFLYVMKKRQILKEQLVHILDANSATVLHWATLYNCTKTVREILQLFEKCDPVSESERYLMSDLILAKDFESVTPLHLAATKMDTKILRMFIEALKMYPPKAELYSIAQDKRTRSPLHYAACKVNLEAIRVLLDNNLGFVVDQRDNTGITPLMCAVGVNLPQALPVIRLLVLKKPVSKTRQSRDGMTALHIAVAARNLEAVILLLDELKCAVDLVDNEQRTPLHYAAEHGYPEIVEYLLKMGARNSTRDHIGATPAHYAAQFSVDCLKVIFKESKIAEVHDNENRSCLMWAVCAGNIDVIHHMVQQKENAPKRAACDKHGYTALHLAAMVGNEEVCGILMNQGWSHSERDHNSNTALHLASGRGHTDVIRCLVSCGANMNDVDEVGRTPLFWACMGGQAHTLHCMIKELSFEWRTSGPTNSRPKTDNFGRTALHAAANAGSSACINVLLNIEKEDIFLRAPLVDWLDDNGETALHEACLAGKFDCVLLLLKGGSAINAVGKLRKTPLDYAIEAAAQGEGASKLIIDHLKSENALTNNELEDAASKVLTRFIRNLGRRNKLRTVTRLPGRYD